MPQRKPKAKLVSLLYTPDWWTKWYAQDEPWPSVDVIAGKVCEAMNANQEMLTDASEATIGEPGVLVTLAREAFFEHLVTAVDGAVPTN